MKILLTVVSQVLLVPVFLSHWTVEQYGCWLIVQTIVGISSILSVGYQNYVGFEFLKAGSGAPLLIRRLFYSALPVVLLISLFELLLVALLAYWGVLALAFDADGSMPPALLREAMWSLVLYSLSWLVSSSAGGMAGRVVAPYGQFPRMAWWNTILALGVALTSGIAVALGAGLLGTVACIAAANLLVNLPLHLDMWSMFRRYGLFPVAPDWRLGWRGAWQSLAISLSTVLDLSRQQGVRIFLGAIIGVAPMTAFSTMRTMSNISLQGIGTITNPIMPEIMRFLRERDAERTDATMGFVWFFSVMLLVPVLIAFQWVMPALFAIWTRGKIAFDPALFGLFSIALLVFAIARPAMAVLQGNNLLRVQLYISIAVSALAVAGIVLLTGRFGVVGAGAVLLLAECGGSVLAVFFAARWLRENGMVFPWQLLRIAAAAIGVAGAGIGAMVLWPTAAAAAAALSAACAVLCCVWFVRRLPAPALEKVAAMARRLPGLRRAG
ncbi:MULTISPECIES: lipopolysaccharide biosynthesis protein [unclassified Janthinobacterium]|uniref:lipopolysaccharide biosynthesis protein n=1 Tax=unclassified Janthinobacterium TaxID=2610881 RepID=UPI0003469C6E|nr:MULTISPECIES: hypothetical protein [unclassified Janthinobacterium]